MNTCNTQISYLLHSFKGKVFFHYSTDSLKKINKTESLKSQTEKWTALALNVQSVKIFWGLTKIYTCTHTHTQMCVSMCVCACVRTCTVYGLINAKIFNLIKTDT